MDILRYLFIFGVIALAAGQIGEYFILVKLPKITGYLVSGMVAGPFVLDILPHEATVDLRFIEEVAISIIAFVAGSELYLEELESRLKSIFSVTTGLVIAVYSLGTAAMFLLADFIPFMADMNTKARLAVSILAGVILVSRSPSSAIAIVKELRAKGPLTKTALGVIIVMDVVVIVFFAFNASLADALLTDVGFNLGFVLLLLFELALSVFLGYVVGRLLQVVLQFRIDDLLKLGLIVIIGYGVFVCSDAIRFYSAENFSTELLVEPLLICLMGSFVVTNYSPYRKEFMNSLLKIEPPIFIAFFTLTGIALELDVVAETWAIMLALFAVRLVGIIVGTFAGGVVAGEPMAQNRVAWMLYITQAGVGLALAKDVAVEFPEFGSELATIMISVIVMNELIGPPFFKSAIKWAGEAHLPENAEPDDIRDAVILGMSGQSLALARQLVGHDWKVIVVDIDDDISDQRGADDGYTLVKINEISLETLEGLVTKATDAFVALCPDDAKNLKACEIVYENFGIPRLIVQVNDPAYVNQFRELGALVLDPASAMVNLLDQSVRAPQSTALFLHMDSEYDTVQITVADQDVVGMSLRALRFRMIRLL
jgi:Kef-type K+ transport system membrane component KefB